MKKLGRNEPCHCGSGKKYKKCCLDEDIERYGKKAIKITNLMDNKEMSYDKGVELYEKERFTEATGEGITSEFTIKLPLPKEEEEIL